MKTKKDIVKEINAFKNTPLAPLKNDLLNNTSGDKYKDCMQYNSMLDNITIGAHTNTTINYAGVDWRLRLLTSEEYVNIRIEVDKRCKDKELFSDYFIAFQTMTLILSSALTPSPFKKEGDAIFSEKDLSYINYDVLEAIYIQYIDFVNVATQRPTEFSDEQIEALWRIYEKKPEVSRELERPKLLAMLNYATNSLRVLKKIQESVMSNSSS